MVMTTRWGTLLFGILYGMSLRFSCDAMFKSLGASLDKHRALHKASFAAQSMLEEEEQQQNVASVSTDYQFSTDKLVLAVIARDNDDSEVAINNIQRLVQSARTRGDWKGPIAVLTRRNVPALTKLAQQDLLLHLVDASRQPTVPELPAFNYDAMEMAQTKTFLLDFVLQDEGIPSETEFVLYVDPDSIISQPLAPWLQQKWQEGRQQRLRYNNNISSMHMFAKGPGRSAHTGLMLLHRDLSVGCLRKWKSLIPRYRNMAPNDEWLIRMMIGSPGPMGCKIWTWSANPEDLQLTPSSSLQDLEQDGELASQFVIVPGNREAAGE